MASSSSWSGVLLPFQCSNTCHEKGCFSNQDVDDAEAGVIVLTADESDATPTAWGRASSSGHASKSGLASNHSLGRQGSKEIARGDRKGTAAGVLTTLTRFLTRSGPEEEEDEAEEQAKDSAAELKKIVTVHSAMRRFMKKIEAKSVGPSEDELALGVQIPPVYDFYDPQLHKVRTRKMNDDVLHQRRTRGQSSRKKDDPEKSLSRQSSRGSSAGSESDDEGSEIGSMISPAGSSGGGSNCSEMSDDEPESPKPMSGGRRRSVQSGGSEKIEKMDKKPPVLKRATTMTDPEIMAKWGTLIGKLMHEKVLDFAALKDKALRKKRVSIEKSDTELTTSHHGRLVLRLQGRASAVVKQAKKLASSIASEENDKLDAEWNDPSLLSYLFSTEYLDTLMLLANAVSKLLHTQPAMAVATAPAMIFGDIHGQLRDLLLLFYAFGTPGDSEGMSYVFNGDFVDRGRHQVEVMGILLALKVMYPDRVWLVRGNHEDRAMNERYGFKDECTRLLGLEFGPKVYELIQGSFDRLPVACLINERILCVHGGIGDGLWKLDDLRTIPKPLTADYMMQPENNWIYNLMWSDPIEDGKTHDPAVFGVHQSPRGSVASSFAWNVTKTFCARNGLSLIVRSHQSKKGSRGFDVMHENMLVRVFSARDYEGHGNDGAVLMVRKGQQPKGDAKFVSGPSAEFLMVRPQVLRSAQKAREESKQRERDLRLSLAKSLGQGQGDEPRRKASGLRSPKSPTGDEPVRRASSLRAPKQASGLRSPRGDEPSRRASGLRLPRGDEPSRQGGAKAQSSTSSIGGNSGEQAVLRAKTAPVKSKEVDNDNPRRRRSAGSIPSAA